jgi:hypothetical protein
MTNAEMVKAAMATIEAGNPERLADFLAEDFQCYGLFDQPINKKQYVVLNTALKQGFPDVALNLAVVKEDSEGLIHCTYAPVATHLDLFILPGLPPLAPSGRSFAAPRDVLIFKVVSGKISELRIEQASGGGFLGLLQYLDVDITDLTVEKIFNDR